jgi:hypothetical protein
MKIFQPILALLLPLKAMACGLDWSPPVSHFENVDYQGNVQIVRKIGEVDKLPVYLIFNSTYGASPYVGSGFEIPFLESRIWQMDENLFQAKMPSGEVMLFRRTKEPSILEGDSGWKALIKDNTISVWATCGDKILFRDGRIVSLILKGALYNYKYTEGRVTSVQNNGNPVLEVEKNVKSGDLTGIKFDRGEHVGIALRESKPIIESVAGKNVVARVEKTIGELTFPNGKIETFEHGVSSSLKPTLQTADSLFVWDPVTKMIIAENEWSYDIKPGKGPLHNAAIGRYNSVNQSEFWYKDPSRGVEITQTLDGKLHTTKRFASGEKLYGKLREVSVKSGDQVLSSKIFRYDEQGRILRKQIDGKLYTYKYDDSERSCVESEVDTGRQISKVFEDENGKILKVIYSDGLVAEFNSESGFRYITVSRGGKSIKAKWDARSFSEYFSSIQ